MKANKTTPENKEVVKPRQPKWRKFKNVLAAATLGAALLSPYTIKLNTNQNKPRVEVVRNEARANSWSSLANQDVVAVNQNAGLEDSSRRALADAAQHPESLSRTDAQNEINQTLQNGVVINAGQLMYRYYDSDTGDYIGATNIDVGGITWTARFGRRRDNLEPTIELIPGQYEGVLQQTYEINMTDHYNLQYFQIINVQEIEVDQNNRRETGIGNGPMVILMELDTGDVEINYTTQTGKTSRLLLSLPHEVLENWLEYGENIMEGYAPRFVRFKEGIDKIVATLDFSLEDEDGVKLVGITFYAVDENNQVVPGTLAPNITTSVDDPGNPDEVGFMVQEIQDNLSSNTQTQNPVRNAQNQYNTTQNISNRALEYAQARAEQVGRR